MTATEILNTLKSLGAESYKRTLLRHGVKEPCYGVKIEELKKIQKRVKRDYALALALYDTGVYDAMYLAGLIADESRMTKRDLRGWLKRADSPPLAEYTVPWVAAESRHGHDLALDWIESRQEPVAAAGWATLSGLVAITADADLDLAELKRLLRRVGSSIHEQKNRVRYAMNGFVISVGCYVTELTELALQTASKIGPVEVDMGETVCQVPSAVEYIRKVEKRGTLGRKRNTVRC